MGTYRLHVHLFDTEISCFEDVSCVLSHIYTEVVWGKAYERLLLCLLEYVIRYTHIVSIRMVAFWNYITKMERKVPTKQPF